jgi:uncharacterized protein YggE
MKRKDLLIAAIAVALGGFGCQGKTIVRTEADSDNRVHVAGFASVEVTPDVATTTIGVHAFDGDAVLAVTQNNERVAAVINTLEGLGVAEKDMQTSGF